MTPLPDDAQLSAFARFMKSLSQEGVVLVLLLVSGGVVLYAMYEVRGQWAPLLWSSPWVAVIGGLAMLSFAGWSALSSMQRRLEARMAEQIHLLEESLSTCHDERSEMRTQMNGMLVSEAQLKVQVQGLQREVDLLKIRRRGTDSDFGGLHG